MGEGGIHAVRQAAAVRKGKLIQHNRFDAELDVEKRREECESVEQLQGALTGTPLYLRPMGVGAFAPQGPAVDMAALVGGARMDGCQ